MPKAARKKRLHDQRKRTVGISITAILAAAAFAVGCSVALLTLHMSVPEDLQSTRQPGSITVDTGAYDNAQPVTIRVTQGTDNTLRAPVEGILTHYDCATGTTVDSGSAPLAINGRNILALHTTTPLYRTLKSGVQGTDVQALHDELRALGYAAPESDIFAWESVEAFNALADAHGTAPASEENGWSVTPDMVMWIPSRSVMIKECPVRMGATLQTGTDVMLAAPSIVGAAIVHDDSNSAATAATPLVAGMRTIGIGVASFDVTPNSNAEQSVEPLTGHALLDAIAMSQEYQAAAAGDVQATMGATPTDQSQSAMGNAVDVTYQWRLKEPMTVAFVPPAALYDVQNGKACVVADGEPRAVTIVASQLGRAMVTVEDGSTLHTVELSRANASDKDGMNAKACR